MIMVLSLNVHEGLTFSWFLKALDRTLNLNVLGIPLL